MGVKPVPGVQATLPKNQETISGVARVGGQGGRRRLVLAPKHAGAPPQTPLGLRPKPRWRLPPLTPLSPNSLRTRFNQASRFDPPRVAKFV